MGAMTPHCVKVTGIGTLDGAVTLSPGLICQVVDIVPATDCPRARHHRWTFSPGQYGMFDSMDGMI